jgi:HK97 family phage prohead protease
MKLYLPIAKVDAVQRLVYGYASTEARDDQGEIVKREALQEALGDYMRFGNIREMHQLSAVGKAKDAAIDDKGLYLGAKVVDDRAWEKVKEGVYNGFSIGGKVLERAAGDPKTINKLRLDEISLVDRPANPETVFDCWKRSASAAEDDPLHAFKVALERLEAAMKGGDAPGEGDKPFGNVEYADPGYRDGKKRYPIDTEAHIRAAWNYIHKPKNAGEYSAEQLKRIKSKIIAAWKDKIDPKGPPEAEDEKKAAQVEMKKHLADVGFVAQTILQLDQLQDILAQEAIVEGDARQAPTHLGSIVDDLCSFLDALVAEETAEIKADSEDMSGAGDGMAMSAIATSLRKSGLRGRAKAFDALAKARHGQGDQALLDMAHQAVKAARAMPGLTKAEGEHLDECTKSLKAAGANEPAHVESEGGPPATHADVESTQDTGHNAVHPAPKAAPPKQEYRPGEYTTSNSAAHTVKVLDLIAETIGKRRKSHQFLIDVAHGCLGKLTDGQVCQAAKAGGRHSIETMGHLRQAHDHLVGAGAKCDAAGEMDHGIPGAEEEGQGTEEDKQNTARGGDLQKRYDALAAAVAEITPRLDAILKTVERIDRTPLPPMTARSVDGLRRVEKGGPAATDESDEVLMARISRMTPDEQALLLVKAARRRPIIGTGPAPVSPLAAAGDANG